MAYQPTEPVKGKLREGGEDAREKGNPAPKRRRRGEGEVRGPDAKRDRETTTLRQLSTNCFIYERAWQTQSIALGTTRSLAPRGKRNRLLPPKAHMAPTQPRVRRCEGATISSKRRRAKEIIEPPEPVPPNQIIKVK